MCSVVVFSEGFAGVVRERFVLEYVFEVFFCFRFSCIYRG